MNAMNDGRTRILDTALVLEGGGMRGIYTTGVLDAFLDAGLLFDYVIGVSAGASHALSYITRQRGRARRVNVDYCRRADYMGPLCLLREGSLFGMDLLFRKIPLSLDPFDYESFEQNVGRYYAVATDLTTGRPAYLAPRKAGEVLAAAQASCSLPLVSKPVMIGGVPYLDGGIADSIPTGKARADGLSRQVIVLTQPRGYRKSGSSHEWAFRAAYRRYPAFAEALATRNQRYNAALDEIDELERTGAAIVIRPQPQPGLNRLERDPIALDGLWRSGYADATALADRLREFSA